MEGSGQDSWATPWMALEIYRQVDNTCHTELGQEKIRGEQDLREDKRGRGASWGITTVSKTKIKLTSLETSEGRF